MQVVKLVLTAIPSVTIAALLATLAQSVQNLKTRPQPNPKLLPTIPILPILQWQLPVIH